jgi:hypothetical protein
MACWYFSFGNLCSKWLVSCLICYCMVWKCTFQCQRLKYCTITSYQSDAFFLAATYWRQQYAWWYLLLEIRFWYAMPWFQCSSKLTSSQSPSFWFAVKIWVTVLQVFEVDHWNWCQLHSSHGDCIWVHEMQGFYKQFFIKSVQSLDCADQRS